MKINKQYVLTMPLNNMTINTNENLKTYSPVHLFRIG